jgi:hypothetical protein
MPDENVDPVQPPEGQGGSDNEAPYAEYLSRIPEEARGEAEAAFKEWDASTTRRFQAQAEAQERWKPYEEAGINQLSPDEAKWAREFYGALDNPQAIQQWYQQYAEQNGLTVAEAQQQAPPPDEFGTYTDPGIEDVLKQHLSPIERQLQEFADWRTSEMQKGQAAEAQRYVDSEVERLKKAHPDDYDEPLVNRLDAQYQTTDPRNAVQRAFDDSMAIRSQLEKKFLQGKANVPASAESGGSPDGAPEQIKTLDRAKEVALARLREGNRQ